MTPEERARRIVGENIDGNKYHDAKINLIAAQIREACEEAEKRSNEFSAMRIIEVEKCCAENAYKAGRASMREEAATLIENQLYISGPLIAQLIRAIPVEAK